MKRRKVKEVISKAFMLSLLAPYHPTLKPEEKITDIWFEADPKNSLETFEIGYLIVKGGVNDSKELRKGD